jgi:hypothetical protein
MVIPVYQLDWGGGYLSGDGEDTWYYIIAWVIHDGGSKRIDLYTQFLGSYPSKYDGGTYSYANTNGTIIRTNIGELGDQYPCTYAISWLVLWGPNQ